MPNPNNKPVEPSLLQKIFGYGEMSPEIQQGIAIAKKEHPNMPTPSRMGLLGRVFSPAGALAITTPMSSISMNDSLLQGYNPQDIADILTHENTHIEQNKREGLLGGMYRNAQDINTPYFQRPNEVEAYRATSMRQERMGNQVDPVPSVLGGFYKPHDINLDHPPMQYAKLNPKTGQYEKSR